MEDQKTEKKKSIGLYFLTFVNIWKSNKALGLFLTAFFIVGLILAYTGAKDIYVKKIQSRDWVVTEGMYVDKKPYKSRAGAMRYWLHYQYTVNGRVYGADTDYITTEIPQYGSKITIKYDPSNPENAIFPDQSANLPLFIAGLCFFDFPLIILAMLSGRFRTALVLGGFIFAAFILIFIIAT